MENWADRAQHPQPTGLGHGGDDVAAVAEGEDRQIDADELSGLGAHPPRLAF